MKGAWVVCLVVLGSGCALDRSARHDVALLGPPRAAKPDGCALQIFLADGPAYAVTPVASGRAQCWQREACIDELKVEACQAGADVIYGVREGFANTETVMSGVFGVAAAPGSTPPSAAGCNPICSPGFSCDRGTCVPQCNPACAPGLVCGAERLCVAPSATPGAPR